MIEPGSRTYSHGKVFIQKKAFLLFASLALASGCATKIDAPALGGNAEAAKPRLAVEDAALALQQTSWPSPSGPSLFERLAGVAGEKPPALSRNAAIEIYLDQLNKSDAPIEQLLADADQTIKKAERLTSVAEDALALAAPRMSDVAVLEKAIQQLRACKSVYVDVAAQLGGSLEERALTALSLKGRFDAVTLQVADLADRYADKAAAATAVSAAKANPAPRNTATNGHGAVAINGSP